MQDYSKIHSRINTGRTSSVSQGTRGAETVSKNAFDQILQQKIDEKELKISQHAQKRLNMRNISLTANHMEKLNSAVDKANQKGIKESLILMNDLAFVVNIKNKTVITAIDGASIKENVFTNIDGAVIL
ncbi:MAG: flagellar protein [Tepidanaerobacteraceae bacterium]|nr:flagellar protein [Tepidanaerobacteraceae bacterium]